jgi:hypothetical protein
MDTIEQNDSASNAERVTLVNIQSAPASSTAWRGQVATSPVS